MAKFFQKQTKDQQHNVKDQSAINTDVNPPKKKAVNKFKGIAEDLEWFEPVIIPGYITIG